MKEYSDSIQMQMHWATWDAVIALVTSFFFLLLALHAGSLWPFEWWSLLELCVAWQPCYKQTPISDGKMRKRTFTHLLINRSQVSITETMNSYIVDSWLHCVPKHLKLNLRVGSVVRLHRFTQTPCRYVYLLWSIQGLKTNMFEATDEKRIFVKGKPLCAH